VPWVCFDIDPSLLGFVANHVAQGAVHVPAEDALFMTGSDVVVEADRDWKLQSSSCNSLVTVMYPSAGAITGRATGLMAMTAMGRQLLVRRGAMGKLVVTAEAWAQVGVEAVEGVA
jgi:hypothetical protein